MLTMIIQILHILIVLTILMTMMNIYVGIMPRDCPVTVVSVTCRDQHTTSTEGSNTIELSTYSSVTQDYTSSTEGSNHSCDTELSTLSDISEHSSSTVTSD